MIFAHSNACTHKWPGAVNNLPSMTVPGQEVTVAQLFERLTRGRDVPELNGIYTDAVPPGIEMMDNFQRRDLAQRLRVQQLALQEELVMLAEKEKEKKPGPVTDDPTKKPAPTPEKEKVEEKG